MGVLVVVRVFGRRIVEVAEVWEWEVGPLVVVGVIPHGHEVDQVEVCGPRDLQSEDSGVNEFDELDLAARVLSYSGRDSKCGVHDSVGSGVAKRLRGRVHP
jgi:hypothetical protein